MGLRIPVETPRWGVYLGLVDDVGQRRRSTGTPLPRGESLGLVIPVETPRWGVYLVLVDDVGQRRRSTGTPLRRGGWVVWQLIRHLTLL